MTFFSGTDISTLRSEGNERNCFVSLIVNNAGTYAAAITRKIQKKTEVTTKSLGTSYEFFGEGTIKTDEDPMSESTQVINDEVIEYFMLDIEKEEVDNPLSYLDKRFEEIKDKKAQKEKKSAWLPSTDWSKMPFPKSNINNLSNSHLNYQSGNDEGFYKWWNEKKEKQAEKEPSLFSDEDLEEMEASYGYVPDPTLIRNTIVQMLACSLNINVAKDFNLKSWIEKHMQRIYDNVFKDINDASSTDKFEVWCDFIVDYMVHYFQDPAMPDDCLDYSSEVAEAMLEQLQPFRDNNPYMQTYCETLESYIDE